jgi:hypothetical protein
VKSTTAITQELPAFEPTTAEMLCNRKSYRDEHYDTELRTTVEMPVVSDKELADFLPQSRRANPR